MEQTGGAGRVQVHKVGGLKLLALWLLSLPARLYYATLRYRVSEPDRTALLDASVPTVLVIWHNRILTSPGIRRNFRNKRRISAIISASRDGALISAFIGMLGIDSCRGSSSKRAAVVAMELLDELKTGNDIAVTPDGPRGPLYTFHEGAAALALMAGAPVILVCPVVKHGMRFNSWDGFYLPWPCTKIEMRARRFLPAELPQNRAECALFLRKVMLDLTEDLPDPPRTMASREKAKV
jgi:lysophospholipid acyltransferase (LPLAT)-like uncharacterized protein